MKTICTFIAIALAAVLQAAVVPTEWQVRVGPKATVFQAERYHGDALALRATLTSNGQPLPYQGTASLYAQTNGMGAAWWNLADATVSNNVLSATWLPEYDTGADVVDVFLGAPGSYQAHARIRFLPSPGATPGALPLPVPVLDFATVQVLNAPYLDASDVTNAAEAAVGRFEESLKYGMDVGTGAVYGFAGDDCSGAYGLAWDGAWKYIRYGEWWTTPGTELARMGDIPDLSHYATMEAATNEAAAVVARDAVTTSYGPGGGTFGWTGPHVIGGTGFDLFLPGGLTVGNNRISTAGGHSLTLPERSGTVALSSDISQVVALVGQTSSTLSHAITNDSISAYASSATNSLGGIVYRLGAVSVSAQVDEAMSDLLGSDWKATYGGGAAGVVAALLAAVAALWRTKLNSSNGTATNLKADGLETKLSDRMVVTYGSWTNVEVLPVAGSANTWRPLDESFTLMVLGDTTCSILASGASSPTLLGHAETALPWTLVLPADPTTPVGTVSAAWADVATVPDLRYDIVDAEMGAELDAGLFPISIWDSPDADSMTTPDHTATRADVTLVPVFDQSTLSAVEVYYGGAKTTTVDSSGHTDATGYTVMFNMSATLSNARVTASLADRAVNRVETAEASISLILPAAVPGKVRDLLVDVPNNGTTDIALEFEGLGTDFALAPLADDDIAEITTVEAGDKARLYVTETSFTHTPSGGSELPVIQIGRVTLGEVAAAIMRGA